MAKTNYMMTVDDVAQELGVSKQKGYRIIRQLNEELEHMKELCKEHNSLYEKKE